MMPKYTPSSTTEVASIVKDGHIRGEHILACGNQTRLDRHLLDPQAERMSLLELNRIIFIDPAEQICEIETGVNEAQLQAALAEFNLELGACFPEATTGTLGGAFMSPDISMYRSKWGNPREQVLGGKWILPNGDLVETGTRVVKSVAGYDLTRLFLGSRGQLATCVSLVLRLRPLARHQQWWTLPHECAKELPNPHQLDFLFTLGGENKYWLRADELAFVANESYQAQSNTEGDAALQQALDSFAKSSGRFTSSKVCDLNPQLGTTDWLGNQQGCTQSEIPRNCDSYFPRPKEMAWRDEIHLAISNCDANNTEGPSC